MKNCTELLKMTGWNGRGSIRVSERRSLNEQGTSREKLRRWVICFGREKTNVVDERI
jgi:hypothetical protein